MENKKLSVQKSILWNSVGSLIYLATQWLITILVVRLAGVDAAGNLTLAMSVGNLMYSIALFGMRNFQVSDIAEEYRNGVYIASRIITCFASVVIGAVYVLCMSYTAEQRWCIGIYCVFKASEALYDVYAGISQKVWRMDYIGKSWVTKGLFTFAAFCGVLYFTKNIVFAILAMTAVSFAVILLYDIPKNREIAEISILWKGKEIVSLLYKCIPLLVYSMLTTAIATVPRLILEKFCGGYALGIYGSVAAPTMIVQMGASYIYSPFITLFAERYHHKDKKGFWKAFRNCFLAIAVLSVCAMIGGKLLGRWGLMLLYGEEVAVHEALLLPLIVATILTAILWLFCGILTVVREFKGLIIGNVAAVLFSAVCSLVLIPRLEMQGATIALIIALGISCCILFGCLCRSWRDN